MENIRFSQKISQTFSWLNKPNLVALSSCYVAHKTENYPDSIEMMRWRWTEIAFDSHTHTRTHIVPEEEKNKKTKQHRFSMTVRKNDCDVMVCQTHASDFQPNQGKFIQYDAMPTVFFSSLSILWMYGARHHTTAAAAPATATSAVARSHNISSVASNESDSFSILWING